MNAAGGIHSITSDSRPCITETGRDFRGGSEGGSQGEVLGKKGELCGDVEEIGEVKETDK